VWLFVTLQAEKKGCGGVHFLYGLELVLSPQDLETIVKTKKIVITKNNNHNKKTIKKEIKKKMRTTRQKFNLILTLAAMLTMAQTAWAGMPFPSTRASGKLQHYI